MAKKPQYKLRFKPTPISRLRHYRRPLKMVGDPDWGRAWEKNAWANREKAVYAYEMDRKIHDNSCGYSLDTYRKAIEDNERLGCLIKI